MDKEIKVINQNAVDYDEEYLDLLEEEMEEEARKKKIKIVLATVIVFIAVVLLIGYIYNEKSAKYKEAMILYSQGNCLGAAEAFTASGIQDATRMAQKCYYEAGEYALLEHDYTSAKDYFASAGDYFDAADMVTKVKYREAIDVYKSGEVASSIELFNELGDYNQAPLLKEWATLEAKYVGYEGLELFDAYPNARAAEIALEENVYGAWVDADGNLLEIEPLTINGKYYTVAVAEGYGAYSNMAGMIENENYYNYVVIPSMNGAILYDILNDISYTNPEKNEECDSIIQKYSDDAIVNRALDMYTECKTDSEIVTNTGIKDVLLGMIPAHYSVKDAVVNFDTNTGIYTADFKAVFVGDTFSAFKTDDCPGEFVHVVYYDTNAGLRLVDFKVDWSQEK